MKSESMSSATATAAAAAAAASATPAVECGWAGCKVSCAGAGQLALHIEQHTETEEARACCWRGCAVRLAPHSPQQLTD